MKTQAIVLALVAVGTAVVFGTSGCGGIINEDAKAKLFEDIGNTSMTVFPVFVRDGEQKRYDPGAANTIGEFLTQENLATVTVSQAEVPITSQWGINQAKMFRDSAADFATYVRENPLETDYALLAEYLFGGRGDPSGVHVYLLDAEGTVAWANLLNSHHKAFTDVDPQTTDDCTTLVINVMRDEFVSQDAGKGVAAAKTPGRGSALTILPVVLAGKSSKDVADVVGLLLEKEGMDNITTVESTFKPPAGATLPEITSAVAEFVRRNPLEADYVLFGEFLGSPGSGVDEVRAVLVSGAGEVVWTDRQTPADADFQRVKPRNPMTCCVLLKERLRPQFKLTWATRSGAGEGHMAKLWAEKSGTPTKAEWAAMERRQKQMKAALATGTILVFPVRLGTELSTDDARQLSELLASSLACTTKNAKTPLPLEIRPSSNEQRRLWDLAKAFRAHVRENTPEADYALYSEYTIRPSDQKVWSVHFVVCDRAGQWVIVDFQNEYQADFKAVDPQTRADCGRLVARRLTSYLR